MQKSSGMREVANDMTRSETAKTVVQETRLVTTGTDISRTRFPGTKELTKVANDGGNVVAAEDVALVEHHQRDRETQAQVDIYEVYLRQMSGQCLWSSGVLRTFALMCFWYISSTHGEQR